MADEPTTPPRRGMRRSGGSEEKPSGSGPQWRVEGARDDKEPSGEEPPRGRPPWAGLTFWIVLAGLLVLSFTIVQQFGGEEDRLNVPYTLFVTQVQDGNVTEITSEGETIQGDFENEVEYDGNSDTKFETERPEFAEDNLLEELTNQGVVVNARPIDDGRPLWQTLLFTFGPVLLLVGLFLFIFRRAAQGAAGGAGALTGLGRSRARRFDETARRVSFDDVAGIQEAKDELVEIVDFLKDPAKYRRLGGEIPRGVLLYGPPGTGKTLLARAVAGEADVPFFSLSASEFVEMIVGVGASRVRDLFQQAKDAAPAIIFIDELDAIGRRRGGAATVGTNDEREQTLNQILTEMDGFTGTEGVIVLGATNRPEVLDAALLRPGRFDRRVAVQPPDQAGRAKILGVHTRNMPLADDVDLDAIAASTPGMVGADLKNLTNEAALTAARRGHEQVENADFTDALEKVVLGTERNIMLSHAEKERTAYHESGHALLGMLIPGADPVRKVSIVPRGQALGVTFQAPDADRYGYDAEYLRGRIVGALGGRAAEDLIYGNVTTGAESDLEQVTGIARQMVGRWGMSPEIGPIAVLPPDSDNGLVAPRVSPQTQELVDKEVRRIVDECYGQAMELLGENREKLEALTKELLITETLDEADAYKAAGLPRPRRPNASADEPSADDGDAVVTAAADEDGDAAEAPSA